MVFGQSPFSRALRQASTDPNGCRHQFPRIALDWQIPVSQQMPLGFQAFARPLRRWRPRSIERELLYTAIARHLAAHCPTRRSSGQSVTVALRFHQGEEIYSG